MSAQITAMIEDAPGCIYCEETDITPSVECWEMYDLVVCEDCADQAHEDNSQFGAGA